jgi:hypothetical protein
MTNQRKIIAAAALLATFAFAPTAAPASPLLSGYGGPGQGSQAILGSALLNGGQGGGGSSAGPPGGSLTAAGTSAEAPVESAAPAASNSSSKGSHPAKSVHRHNPASSRSKPAAATSGDASPAYIVAKRASDEPFLALSEGDVLGAIAVLVVLALTALATRQLARRDAGAAEPKGVTRNSRANG